jgi:hypothetical protein
MAAFINSLHGDNDDSKLMSLVIGVTMTPQRYSVTMDLSSLLSMDPQPVFKE